MKIVLLGINGEDRQAPSRLPFPRIHVWIWGAPSSRSTGSFARRCLCSSQTEPHRKILLSGGLYHPTDPLWPVQNCAFPGDEGFIRDPNGLIPRRLLCLDEVGAQTCKAFFFLSFSSSLSLPTDNLFALVTTRQRCIASLHTQFLHPLDGDTSGVATALDGPRFHNFLINQHTLEGFPPFFNLSKLLFCITLQSCSPVHAPAIFAILIPNIRILNK